jgi:hypothetical protein
LASWTRPRKLGDPVSTFVVMAILIVNFGVLAVRNWRNAEKAE